MLAFDQDGNEIRPGLQSVEKQPKRSSMEIALSGMQRLMDDPDLRMSPTEAAGVMGSLWHESGGFKQMQELKPVAGRGGYGWAQWTGPRRRQFEEFVRSNNLDPASDEANFQFLKHELTNTSEGRVLAPLKQAKSETEASDTFTKVFERPGVPALSQRRRNARNIMLAFNGGGAVPEQTTDAGFKYFTDADAAQVQFSEPNGMVEPQVAPKPQEPTLMDRGKQFMTDAGNAIQDVGYNISMTPADKNPMNPGNLAGAAKAGAYGLAEGGAGLMQAGLEGTHRYLTGPVTNALGVPDPMLYSAQQYGLARRKMKEAGDKALPQTGNPTLDAVYSGVQSVSQNAFPLVAGLLTGQPEIALAGLSGAVGGQEYGKARDLGKGFEESLVYGGTQAGIEYLTERLPVGKLFSDIKADTALWKTIGRQIATEIPGEEAATVLQSIEEKAALHPEKTWSQLADELPGQMYQTAIATIVAAGAQSAIGHTVQKTADRIAESTKLQTLMADPEFRNIMATEVDPKLKGLEKGKAAKAIWAQRQALKGLTDKPDDATISSTGIPGETNAQDTDVSNQGNGAQGREGDQVAAQAPRQGGEGGIPPQGIDAAQGPQIAPEIRQAPDGQFQLVDTNTGTVISQHPTDVDAFEALDQLNADLRETETPATTETTNGQNVSAAPAGEIQTGSQPEAGTVLPESLDGSAQLQGTGQETQPQGHHGLNLPAGGQGIPGTTGATNASDTQGSAGAQVGGIAAGSQGVAGGEQRPAVPAGNAGGTGVGGQLDGAAQQSTATQGKLGGQPDDARTLERQPQQNTKDYWDSLDATSRAAWAEELGMPKIATQSWEQMPIQARRLIKGVSRPTAEQSSPVQLTSRQESELRGQNAVQKKLGKPPITPEQYLAQSKPANNDQVVIDDYNRAVDQLNTPQSGGAGDSGAVLHQKIKAATTLPRRGFVQRRVAESVAKVFGHRVVFIEHEDGVTPLDRDGAIIGAHPDVILINKDSQDTFSRVVAHELTHGLRRRSPEIYRTMVQGLREVYSPIGVSMHLKDREYQQDLPEKGDAIAAYPGLEDPSRNEEEWVSDFVSDVIHKPMGLLRVAAAMSRNKPGAGARFLRHVDAFLSTLTGKLSGRGFNAEAAIAKENLQRARNAVTEALARYAEVQQTGVEPEYDGPEILESKRRDIDATAGQEFTSRDNVGEYNLSVERAERKRNIKSSLSPEETQVITAAAADKGVPAKDALAAAMREVNAVLKNDENVMTYRMLPTRGLYGNDVERSFDTEVIGNAKWQPGEWGATLAKMAKETNQKDIFLSRVLGPNESHPNARPGLVISFKNDLTSDEVKPILDTLRANGVDGFTLSVSPIHARNLKGGQEAKSFQGIRIQYVPEFTLRAKEQGWDYDEDELQKLTSGDDAQVQEVTRARRDVMVSAAEALGDNDAVAHTKVYSFDTLVIGKENYADYSGSPERVDREVGKGSSGQPIAERLQGAARRLGVQRGQERGATVLQRESGGPDIPASTKRKAAGSADAGPVSESGRVRGSDGLLAEPRRPYQGDGRQGTTLQGLPRRIDVDGQIVEFAGYAPAQEAARRYMQKAGLKYNPPTTYAKVDKARAKRIADAFDSMAHDPQNAAVKMAYRQMIKETIAQYQAILDTGLKIEFIDFAKTGDPYGNPRNAILDVVENNHLWVFSTRDGFGSNDKFDPVDNPLLQETEFKISGQVALANDLFRAVHDYFGHIKEGVGFRAEGEENAWRAHSAMYSSIARRAMTTETRGQNSWVNYGPFGEYNQTASGETTKYADQKIGLLPKWVSDEGATDIPASNRRPDAAGNERAGASAESDQRPSYGQTKRGGVRAVGVHYSGVERQELDGSFYGTGAKGEEADRVRRAADKRLAKRIYFYINAGQGVSPEQGVGGNAHTVLLKNLYDINADPLFIQDKVTGTTQEEINNNLESAIIDAGFDGYVADFGNQRAAVLIGDHKVPVRFEGQGRPQVEEGERAEPNANKRLAKLMGQDWSRKTPEAWGEYVKGKNPFLYERYAASFVGTGEKFWPDEMASRAKKGAKPDIPASNRRGVDARILADNTLPSGSILPSAWKQVLTKAMPEIVPQLDSQGVFDGSERMYRDELVRKVRDKLGIQPPDRSPKAAGILFRARDTGRIFLGKRSNRVAAPHTWSTPGGAVEDGEDLETAARREVSEEMGGVKVLSMRPIAESKWREVTYTTFLADVPTEFTPTLNHEHSAGQWFDPDQLPDALHPGMQAIKQQVRDAVKKADIPASNRRQTINVGGKERPQLNSEGRPIHPTEEGLRNFWRWFGDSRVVDADGRPLIVYHGTAGERTVFEPYWKQLERDAMPHELEGDGTIAKMYRQAKDEPELHFFFIERGSAETYGSDIVEAYLRVIDPAVDDDRDAALASMLDNDNDGATFSDTTSSGRFGGTAWAIRSSNQAKSATQNTGEFGPSMDLRFSNKRNPTFYSQLAKGFESSKMNSMPGSQWKAWLFSNKAKLGIKDDEIAWTGIDDFLTLNAKEKLTKAEIADYLSQNGVQVQDVMKGDSDKKLEFREWAMLNFPEEHQRVLDFQDAGDMENAVSLRNILLRNYQAGMGKSVENPTKFSQHTIPGGTNYRELLITLPSRNQEKVEYLVGLPNAGSSAVFATREAAEAHQSRMSGSVITTRPLTGAARGMDSPDYRSSHWDEPNVLAHLRFDERTDADGSRVMFITEIQSDWGQGFKKYKDQNTDDLETALRQVDKNPVPKAPFITDTKAWVSLALKRAIRYASENGFDKIAFANGQQNADLYDLSKQVDEIRYLKGRGGATVTLEAIKDGSHVFNRNNVPMAEVEDIVGKELAQKIENDEGESDWDTGYRKLSGLDLKVGGEGMRAFYDTIVPSVANDVLKKLGGSRVGTVTVNTGISAADWDEANSRMRRQLAEDGAVTEQPGFPITPALQDKALSGMPLFSNKRNVLGQPALATWTMPDDSKLERWTYLLQDKHIDTKRVVERLKTRVADAWDPYLKETLYHGRAAKDVDDFKVGEVRPLLQAMSTRGITIGELETFLWNRHAPEANAQIAKINPAYPDGGSGINTQDALDYLANLPAGKRTDLEALAAQIDAITAGTRRLLVDSGLETQDTIDAWEATYSDYIPLQRETDDLAQKGMGTGQGFSTKGSASKRRTGSGRAVEDILANVMMQRERAITRAEKNKVGLALYGLAIQNPNPEFWYPVNPDAVKNPAKVAQELVSMGMLDSDLAGIIQEPTVAQINPRTGLVEYKINPLLRNRDNVLAVRIKGKDRFLFFSTENERAIRMAQSLKNLDAPDMHGLMNAFRMVTRYISSINTQYNPIFGAVNLIRDTGAGLLNLSTTPLAGKQTEVMSHIMPALTGIYGDLRADRKGKPRKSSQWSQLWEEFQTVGGKTGYRDMYATAEERAKALESELKKIQDGTVKRLTRGLFDWLSDYNETLENAVRLSAYKAGIDSGMTKERAAVMAKELTVNFNRKGQVASQAGSLYAFFNAAMQGTARLAETVKGPAGKKIVAGGLLMGIVQAVLLAAAGYDDDEPPEFVRERNFIIPLPNGKYANIPLPLGFHVLPNTGRVITETFMNPDDAGKKIAGLLGSYFEAFNPIGSAGWSVQTIAPTFADPLVALSENRDSFGKEIAKKDRTQTNPTPGFTRTKDTASWLSKNLAWGINKLTGGTDYVQGAISPTPDQLDFLFGQATGGVGREVMKIEQAASSWMSGEELPPYKYPLGVGRFVGDTKSQSADANRFYANITRLNEFENEIKGRAKDGKDVAGFMKENPESRLVSAGNSAERAVTELRSRKRKLIEQKAPKATIKALEGQIAQQMKALNDQVKMTRMQRLR